MVEFEEWFSQFETEEIEGEPHAVVMEEEKELATHYYIVSYSNLAQMFGRVIAEAESKEDIDPDDLKERSKPHPDQFGEMAKSDWGYEKVIDSWDENGYI